LALADFIESRREPILAAWEAFAASSGPAARHLSRRELRDHAPQILDAIVADLRAGVRQVDPAAVPPDDAAPSRTAAQTHALLRVREGLDIDQLVSEYRALRASVLRLCRQAGPTEAPTLDEMICFDDAIDQALAESVEHFSQQVERSRNLLLGMLSHDMCSPLQAIQTTARYLTRIAADEAVAAAAERLGRSCERIQSLLDDLVDFNRSRLGLGVAVTPRRVDLHAAFEQELEMIRAARPDGAVTLAANGDCRGHWDDRRLQQLLSNLVLNALDYGVQGGTVRVALHGEDGRVRIEVANDGTPIEPATLARIFEPLARGDADGRRSGLGLGLYIVDEIAKAHGGSAQARSDAGGTVFTIDLPRAVVDGGGRPPAVPGEPSSRHAV